MFPSLLVYLRFIIDMLASIKMWCQSQIIPGKDAWNLIFLEIRIIVFSMESWSCFWKKFLPSDWKLRLEKSENVCSVEWKLRHMGLDWLLVQVGGWQSQTPNIPTRITKQRKTESGWPWKKKEYQWLMSCIFLHEMLVISSFAFVCMLMWGVMFGVWIQVLCPSLTQVLVC